MGIEYRDSSIPNSPFIEVPEGVRWEQQREADLSRPLYQEAYYLATRITGGKLYCGSPINAPVTISSESIINSLRNGNPNPSIDFSSYEFLGTERPEGDLDSNWVTSESNFLYGLFSEDSVDFTTQFDRLQRLLSSELQERGLTDGFILPATRGAFGRSFLDEFVTISRSQVGGNGSEYYRAPVYPDKPEFLGSATIYQFVTQLKIFDASGSVLVDLSRDRGFWQVRSNRKCPPSTCPVDCETHICCYGSNGLAVTSFAK